MLMLPWDLRIAGWAGNRTYTSSRTWIRSPPKMPVASSHLDQFPRMQAMMRNCSISIRGASRVHLWVVVMLYFYRVCQLCHCLKVEAFEDWYLWSLSFRLCSACMKSLDTIPARLDWDRWLVRGPRTSGLVDDSDQGRHWPWQLPYWVFRRCLK